MDWGSFMRDGHFAGACAVIDRRLSGAMRRRFDAADFVQDAIVDILVMPDGFDLDRPVFSLVINLARRRLIDELRRPRQRLHEAAFPDGWDAAGKWLLPDELIWISELREQLIAMGGTPRIRQAIGLRLDGYELSEIEPLVGWKRGAAHMAFKRLRRNGGIHLQG